MATQYFNRFASYCQMIKDAKDVARRSILVDHCGSTHIDLKRGLSNIDHVYSIERESKRYLSRLSLIEFKSIDDAEAAAKNSRHCDGLLPVPSMFLQYRGASLAKFNKADYPHPVEQVKLSLRNDQTATDLDRYTDMIARHKMSLVGLKLRFITLVNLERVLCSGLFEEYELMPYGSSVIDIGSDNGDLDLLMTRKIDHQTFIKDFLSKHNFNPNIQYLKTKTSNHSQLTALSHLDKHVYQEQRDSNTVKGAMRLFDHILRQYMPLADSHSVMSVPHAKVPIIKFTARMACIDCDLSFNLGLEEATQTYSGILMSHILYSMCRHNNLFTGIVVYLRTFGRLAGITGKGGTVKFTNFQFLSLIIFYLQQIELLDYDPKSSDQKSVIHFEIRKSRAKRKTVLPPFNLLFELNFNLDQWKIILDDDQLNQLIPRVVKGFFEYYSNFDFDKASLNLYEGKLDKKPDNSTIYVVNPLEKTRNVCYNVTSRGCDHFVKQIRAALLTTTVDEPRYTDLITQLWSDNPYPIKENSVQ